MPIRVTADDRALHLLLVDIDKARSGIGARVADVLTDTAPTIMRTIDRTVPVDTGALKASMDYTVNRKKSTLRIGALKRSINPKTLRPASTYLGYVHDGTVHMAPRPFIRNAIRKHSGPNSKLMVGLRKAGVTPIDRTINI
jgi:HK97 gp10 family phage protein